MRTATFAVLAAAFASAVSAIDTINIKDRHFYNSKTGKPFFIKGVDYQPGGSSGVKKGQDPLSDPDACARDIFLFQQLGVNTIRIYSVDPALNHDECMTMLAAAGIYLVLDVNSPLEFQHLHNTEPWTTYTPMYLEHIFQVIEVFSGYDNTLAFLAGNEVVHMPGSEVTTPSYLKAVVRDMKGYITNHVPRAIPVGYSNADNIEFRVSLAEYMQCGNVGYVDFWAINSYQWCADATYEESGYGELVSTFQNYSVPIFFSEFGCIEVKPRKWNDVRAIYSDKMTGVFSGGLVYEMTETGNDYGLIDVASNGDATLTVEFDGLAQAAKDAGAGSIPSNVEINKRPTSCGSISDYPGIEPLETLPTQLPEISKMVVDGVPKGKWAKGKFVSASALTLETTYTITDADGKEIKDKTIKTEDSITQGPQSTVGHGKDTGGGVGNKLPTDVPLGSSGGNKDDSGSKDDGSDGGDTGAASSISTFTFGTAAMAAVAVLFLAL